MESRITRRQTVVSDFPANEAHSSEVSWAAIIAGGFAAAALCLILLALGSGLGLSSVSPWRNSGLSASAVTIGAVVWLIASQIIAFAIGGYITGRLRKRWATIYSDEVYFRDTAHGFLVWAVGLVITAAFLTSAANSMVGDVGRSPTLMGIGNATAGVVDPYFIDMLLRSDHFSPYRAEPYMQAEVDRIFAHGLEQKGLSDPDRIYLTRIVAERTGLPEADAQARVETVFSHVQQNADVVRKTAAEFSLWLFVALLAGAFFASYCATIGGRERDHVKC
jgi:hypothetical protein